MTEIQFNTLLTLYKEALKGDLNNGTVESELFEAKKTLNRAVVHENKEAVYHAERLISELEFLKGYAKY